MVKIRAFGGHRHGHGAVRRHEYDFPTSHVLTRSPHSLTDSPPHFFLFVPPTTTPPLTAAAAAAAAASLHISTMKTPQAAASPPKFGFSLSPGGLLLPYHLGVLDSLAEAGHLHDETPLAGASAGAIAVACKACQLPSATILDATMALSEVCNAQGGAQLRLIPALRHQMQRLLGPEQLARLQERPADSVGIAYQQLFPTPRPILQSDFTSVEDLIDAVCFSSTFPFFSDTWPVALDKRARENTWLPRVVVDGFFSVPRNRMGCPDLRLLGKNYNAMVNEEEEEEGGDTNNNNNNNEHNTSKDVTEILVACFPQEKVGLTAVPPERCISPPLNALDDINSNNGGSLMGMAAFLQRATETSSSDTYFRMYEQGLADGEAWSAKVASQLILDPSNVSLN